MTEWLKVHAWKACVREYREFESHPLRHLADIVSVIAGSCATKTRELRQVREEATVVRNFVCRRGAWLSFFLDPLPEIFTPKRVCFELIEQFLAIIRTVEGLIPIKWVLNRVQLRRVWEQCPT